MKLISRKPQIWVEEVKLVLPYIDDSGEFSLDLYAEDSETDPDSDSNDDA